MADIQLNENIHTSLLMWPNTYTLYLFNRKKKKISAPTIGLSSESWIACLPLITVYTTLQLIKCFGNKSSYYFFSTSNKRSKSTNA